MSSDKEKNRLDCDWPVCSRECDESCFGQDLNDNNKTINETDIKPGKTSQEPSCKAQATRKEPKGDKTYKQGNTKENGNGKARHHADFLNLCGISWGRT